MRNTSGFNTFLLSTYQCSYAIELEQSRYVTCLAYMNLCLIIHTTYMSRIRAMLRGRFVVPLGVPKSYACRSIGSESQEDLGDFFVHRRGALVQ